MAFGLEFDLITDEKIESELLIDQEIHEHDFG